MNLDNSPAFFKQLYQFEEVYQIPEANDFAIWILVDYPTEKLMPALTLAFLHKILVVVGLKTQDFHITNISSQEVWENYSLACPIAYRQVWGFGEAMKAVFPNLSLLPYAPQEIDHTTYLLSESLEIVQSDTQRKTHLWQSLQKLA